MSESPQDDVYDKLKRKSRFYWICFLIIIVVFVVVSVLIFANYYINIAP